MTRLAIDVIAVGLLSGCVGFTERQIATTPPMATALAASSASLLNAEVTERSYHSITGAVYDAPMFAESSPIIYSAPAGEPCVAGVANSPDCRTGKISQVVPRPPTGSNGKPCPPSETGAGCVISIGGSESKPSIQSPSGEVTNYYRIPNDHPFVPAVRNDLTPEQRTMVYNTAYQACLREKQTGRTPFSTNCDQVAKDSVAHTVSSGPARSSTTPTQLSQQQKSTIYNNAYSSCAQRNQANCASVASNAVTAASNPVTAGKAGAFPQPMAATTPSPGDASKYNNYNGCIENLVTTYRRNMEAALRVATSATEREIVESTMRQQEAMPTASCRQLYPSG